MNLSSAADLASRPIAMASRSAAWPAGWAIRADKPASNPPGGSVPSVAGSSIPPGRSWTRGATPPASLGPVGAGVAGCVGFGVGRGEWTAAGAAAGRDLVNGNVCANVAAIRYPPISTTAVTPAVRARFRPDHEFPGPPEDGWGGGQDGPGGAPAGGQDCGGGPFGAHGCCGGGQNWPRSVALVAEGAGLTRWGGTGGTGEVYDRTR